jgi:hypothetical protein
LVPIQTTYAGPAPFEVAGFSQINLAVAVGTMFLAVGPSFYSDAVRSDEFTVYLANPGCDIRIGPSAASGDCRADARLIQPRRGDGTHPMHVRFYGREKMTAESARALPAARLAAAGAGYLVGSSPMPRPGTHGLSYALPP